MINPPQNEYPLSKDNYVAFDAMSLRELIIRRLNEQNVYTDQNFIGSNLASIIDIVAYSYNTLIYYLNKTSTETMFSEAQLYENMNRIVKLIDYSPIGFQTATLNFTCSALNFDQGIYTIPRYSFLAANNIIYSFNEDVTFAKTTDLTLESLNELAQQKLLYQGQYIEYPVYTASGENNEVLNINATTAIRTVALLNTGQVKSELSQNKLTSEIKVQNSTPETNFIDHFNIDVYVKSVATGTWSRYTKTANLYFEDGYAEKYEIRLSNDNSYELKFGNDINGKKLQTGDIVAIYLLISKGSQGEIGPNQINENIKLQIYNTPQFQEILSNVTQNQFRFLTNNESFNLRFNTPNSSTYSQTKEDVESIRQIAPANYRSQYRLVTTQDYETFVRSNFGNLISDVKVINNWDYISGYLKYFYDIGLNDPAKTGRALFNQVQYADSCNFNNIYLLLVPKSAENTLNYVLPAQKELINSSLMSTKMTTAETAFIDPVYKAVTFGVNLEAFDGTNVDPCELVIQRKTTSRRDNQSILNDVASIFQAYFNRQNVKLGQELNTRIITQAILNIDGIQTLYTRRVIDNTIITPGVSFFVWNPLYPNLDKQIVNNTLPGKYFEYFYFNNLNFIQNSIKVIGTNDTLNLTAEF